MYKNRAKCFSDASDVCGEKNLARKMSKRVFSPADVQSLNKINKILS